MSISDDVSTDQLEQAVQACLTHLYDYAFLQDHPLVQWLVPQETGARQVHKFRELLIQTIEQMRLGEDTAPSSRASRSYNLLALRHIEQQDTQTVIDQLALSERQYYREHPKAIRALSALLRNDRATAASDYLSEDDPPTLSAQTEVQRLQNQGVSAKGLDVDALIGSVILSAQSLADQRRITFDYAPLSGVTIDDVDATILRSTLLWIASDLITQAQPDAHLTIACSVEPRGYQIAFWLTDVVDIPVLHKTIAGHDTLHYLIKTLNGTLNYGETVPDAPCITLVIPFKEQTILVIDDNLDVGDLLRRYLVDQPYHVLTAINREQGIELACQAHPSAIILDIMMPGQDGLAILQILKHTLATQDIPVFICSILDTPDLFFSLGATGFLRKPPGRDDFLKALAQLQE